MVSDGRRQPTLFTVALDGCGSVSIDGRDSLGLADSGALQAAVVLAQGTSAQNVTFLWVEHGRDRRQGHPCG